MGESLQPLVSLAEDKSLQPLDPVKDKTGTTEEFTVAVGAAGFSLLLLFLNALPCQFLCKCCSLVDSLVSQMFHEGRPFSCPHFLVTR